MQIRKIKLKVKFFFMPLFMVFFIHEFSYCKGFGDDPRKKLVAKVNLGSRGFETALPFDESFNITGTASTKVVKIILLYKAVDAKKVTEYFSDPIPKDKITIGSDLFGRSVWERPDDKEEFTLKDIHALRPNIPYEFKFKIFEKVDLKKYEEQIRKVIFSVLVDAFNEPDKIDGSSFDKISTALTSEVDKILSDSGIKLENLKDINENPIIVKPFDTGPLRDISNEIIRFSTDIASRKSEMDNIFNFISFTNIMSDELAIALNKDETIFTDYTKAVLNSSLDESIPTIGKVKIKDAIALFKFLHESPNNLGAIFRGTLKTNGTTLIPSQGIDLNTIDYLDAILNIIDDTPLKYKIIAGTVVNEKEIFEKTNVQSLRNILRQIKKKQSEIESTKENLSKLQALIPTNFITQFFIKNFVIIESATIIQEAAKSSYISLDAGLMSTQNILKVDGKFVGSNIYLFSYQGANIYVVPVNKQARLKEFKGWHALSKSFSFNIGVAQLLNKNIDSRIDFSLGLMTGFGFRFSRMAKVGTSVVWLPVKNINPIVSTSKLRAFPSINLSIDLDIIKAFDGVGKTLKLF